MEGLIIAELPQDLRALDLQTLLQTKGIPDPDVDFLFLRSQIQRRFSYLRKLKTMQLTRLSYLQFSLNSVPPRIQLQNQLQLPAAETGLQIQLVNQMSQLLKMLPSLSMLKRIHHG